MPSASRIAEFLKGAGAKAQEMRYRAYGKGYLTALG